MIGFNDSRIVQVMLNKKKEILYESKGLEVSCVCFCLNNEKFIYSDGREIYVFIKNFSLLNKIIFRDQILELFVNKNKSFVLLHHINNRLSILKAESLKKICEDESNKFFKVWFTRRQDLTFRTHINLPLN